MSQQRIAAVSFLSINERELRQLVESAEAAEEIQGRIKQLDDWVLVQAMDGKPRAVHVMIDAGMTRIGAKNLALSEKGIKLVFSRRLDRPAHEDPFSIRALQDLRVEEAYDNSGDLRPSDHRPVESGHNCHHRGHAKDTIRRTCVASRAFGSDQGLVGSMDYFREAD